MDIQGWYYYNHAALPTTPPHVEPDLRPVESGDIWKFGHPLLARWTTDFDCGYETNWYYVIKDTPFDLSELKAKRRYEINKGNRNFTVKEIIPSEWCEDLYKIAVASYATYPESYRPNITHDGFVSEIKNMKPYKMYGAFSIETDSLCGYACLSRTDPTGNYINFSIMKAIPEQEKFGLNAAMVNKILVDHEEFLSNGGYINDGAKSIYHQTAFQDYLEKYFGFRKAYCKLHIVYKPCVKPIVKLLYPFRKILNKLQKIRIVKRINSLLQLESIHRSAPKNI